MAAFHTAPQGSGTISGIGGPAVINVRRPRGSVSEGPIVAELVRAQADEALPPTVLRLPNLAAIPAVQHGTLQRVLSILHWVFIALGSLAALWLIFGGRGGPVPTEDQLPAPPARAQVDSSPAWNPPPLESGGDSVAPKWTPPASSAQSGTTDDAVPLAPSVDVAPPAVEQSATEATPSEADPMPSYEAWPQGDSATPESAPVAPEPAAQPEEPATPAWQEASAPAIEATAGPVARTASRETPIADPVPGGEAHPLDLTVPVPQ